jgi:hypothetical protein
MSTKYSSDINNMVLEAESCGHISKNKALRMWNVDAVSRVEPE